MDSHFTTQVYKSKSRRLPTSVDFEMVPCRPKKYGIWTQESLDKAVIAVEKGTSIRKAAEMHGIPRSTLHDHVSGRVEMYRKPGPCPYLSSKEEEELATFLVKCAEMGYPHTRQQVLGIVQNILDVKNVDVVVTHGWWERFRNRHPYLTLRTAVPLSFVRAMAQDPEAIRCYFDLLEATLINNDLLDNPTQIFNCDETGIPLNPKPLKTIGKCGMKNPSYITGDSKIQISVLACSSAVGYALPPYIIFDRVTLNQELTRGEVPGTIYGLSKSGWMDTELFKVWFMNHFLKYIPSIRPILLLMDGHSSHFCPEMIRTAAAEGVVLFTLPPHTTHICQPLDKGPFAPLKIEWRKTVHQFLASNCGRTVSRYDFSTLFAETWFKAMTMKNITAGFRVTGIFPFNKDVVRVRMEDIPELKKIPMSSDIKFIPFFSPSQIKNDNLFYDRKLHSTPADRFLSNSPTFTKLTPSNSYSLERNSLERSISESDLHTSSCFLPMKKARSLSKFLITPKFPTKLQKKVGKPSIGRVLTSRENMLFIEEKERLKAEKIALKETKAKQRELKKLEKEREKQKKALDKKKKGNGSLYNYIDELLIMELYCRSKFEVK